MKSVYCAERTGSLTKAVRTSPLEGQLARSFISVHKAKNVNG